MASTGCQSSASLKQLLEDNRLPMVATLVARGDRLLYDDDWVDAATGNCLQQPQPLASASNRLHSTAAAVATIADGAQLLLWRRRRRVAKVRGYCVWRRPACNKGASGAAPAARDLCRVGPRVTIPEDYQGWFALVTEEGKTCGYYSTVATLASAKPRYFLLGASVSAFRRVSPSGDRRHCDNNPSVTYESTTLQTGSVLKNMGTFVDGNNNRRSNATPDIIGITRIGHCGYANDSVGLESSSDGELYMRCLKSEQEEVYLPYEAKGRFYLVAGAHGGNNALPDGHEKSSSEISKKNNLNNAAVISGGLGKVGLERDGSRSVGSGITHGTEVCSDIHKLRSEYKSKGSDLGQEPSSKDPTADSEESINRVYTIHSLLKRHKLPLTIRLVHGPLPSKRRYFTGVISLDKIMFYDTVIACHVSPLLPTSTAGKLTSNHSTHDASLPAEFPPAMLEINVAPEEPQFTTLMNGAELKSAAALDTCSGKCLSTVLEYCDGVASAYGRAIKTEGACILPPSGAPVTSLFLPPSVPTPTESSPVTKEIKASFTPATRLRRHVLGRSSGERPKSSAGTPGVKTPLALTPDGGTTQRKVLAPDPGLELEILAAGGRKADVVEDDLPDEDLDAFFKFTEDVLKISDRGSGAAASHAGGETSDFALAVQRIKRRHRNQQRQPRGQSATSNCNRGGNLSDSSGNLSSGGSSGFGPGAGDSGGSANMDSGFCGSSSPAGSTGSSSSNSLDSLGSSSTGSGAAATGNWTPTRCGGGLGRIEERSSEEAVSRHTRQLETRRHRIQLYLDH